MDDRGDFNVPENQLDDWRALADLVRLVRDYMGRQAARKHSFRNEVNANESKLTEPDHSPADSTLYKRIAPMVQRWRINKSSDN